MLGRFHGIAMRMRANVQDPVSPANVSPSPIAAVPMTNCGDTSKESVARMIKSTPTVTWTCRATLIVDVLATPALIGSPAPRQACNPPSIQVALPKPALARIGALARVRIPELQ